MVNKTHKDYPELRFQQFSDPWVLNTIEGVVSQVTSSKRVHEEDWKTEGIPFYRAREIVSLFDKKSISPLYISHDLYDACSNISGSINPGDILLTGVGTIGIPYLVKPTDNFYFKDGNIVWIKNANIVAGEFLYYFYQLVKTRRKIKEVSSIGTVATYTIENVKKTEIIYPSIDEQRKIATFFTLIDQLIENLEEKIRLLELQKKGIMQRVFSQRLRSQEVDNPWKSKTFYELFDCRSTNSLSRDKLTTDEGTIMNIHYGDIHTKFGMLLDVSKQDLPFVSNSANAIFEETDFCKDMDIIFADASEDYDGVGKSIELMNVGNKRIVSGLHTILARQKTDEMHPGFLGYLMNSSFIHDQIKFYAVGTKVYSISKSNLLKITVTYPSRSEQKNIVDLLQRIDQRIDNLRSLFEQMKILKKWLINRMFL